MLQVVPDSLLLKSEAVLEIEEMTNASGKSSCLFLDEGRRPGDVGIASNSNFPGRGRGALGI